MEIPWDYVTFPLKAEREVQCGSVRVNVGCRLAVSSGESERVQSILAAALHTVLQGDWSFASVQRSEDTTGTEQIDATATIRVPESHTAGIVARLQAAKRPGLRLTLGQMSNRPPREEIEQTRLELRRTIYDAANIELAALNESISMPGRPWELSSIEFSEVVGDASEQQSRSPHFIGRHMRSLSGTEAGDSDSEAGEDIAVGTRLVLQASVTCRRLAIAEPLGGFFGAGSSGPAGSPRGL